MEDEKIITLQLHVTRKHVLAMLAAFFLCWHPKPLGSETLTLTTYYPAPYGGYANLLTTGQTLMARDTGMVGVGTSSPNAGGKVTISGNGLVMTGGSRDLMVVDGESLQIGHINAAGTSFTERVTMNLSGNLGIGNTSPAYKLDVTGTGNISTDLTVGKDARIGYGAASGVGDLYVNNKIMGMCKEYDYSVGADAYCGDSRERIMHAYSGNILTSRCASGGSLFMGGNVEDGGNWVQHYESACSGKIVCCRIE